MALLSHRVIFVATSLFNCNAAALQTPRRRNCISLREKQPYHTTRPLHMTAESVGAKKPKILCLHGKFQNAELFANKIAGARRKLAREYELCFIDGPIILEEGFNGVPVDTVNPPRSWWLRSEDGQTHTLVREALEYAIRQNDREDIIAILGFSQGGTLASALALSGAFPNLKCVVTAGAPLVAEAFEKAAILAEEYSTLDYLENKSISLYDVGLRIPKLHMAGENDALVDVESTRSLSEKAGSGTFIVHEQGHLFPTRSARVQEVLDFFERHIVNK